MKLLGSIVETVSLKENAVQLEAKYSPLTRAVLTGTISSASWSGASAPFTATLTISGILADPVVYLMDVTADATDAQVNAFDYARIRISAQAAGTLSLKAYGVKPTIDIPVRTFKM